MDFTVLIPESPEEQHQMKIALLAVFVDLFDREAAAGRLLIFSTDIREIAVHQVLQNPTYTVNRGDA